MEKFLKEMTNGEYAIVDSKTVILLDKNADFTVCFTFDPDSNVAVRIRFRSDDTMETKVNISTDAETNLITLTCINCENTMEFCSSDPIYLGKYHEKDLYLNFWVNSCRIRFHEKDYLYTLQRIIEKEENHAENIYFHFCSRISSIYRKCDSCEN